MRSGMILKVLSVVSVLVTGSATFADAPFFMGLGDLPGGSFHSKAFGVSADGSVVVGYPMYEHSGIGFRVACVP